MGRKDRIIGIQLEARSPREIVIARRRAHPLRQHKPRRSNPDRRWLLLPGCERKALEAIEQGHEPTSAMLERLRKQAWIAKTHGGWRLTEAGRQACLTIGRREARIAAAG
jgi:hypothetical protein